MVIKSMRLRRLCRSSGGAALSRAANLSQRRIQGMSRDARRSAADGVFLICSAMFASLFLSIFYAALTQAFSRVRYQVSAMRFADSRASFGKTRKNFTPKLNPTMPA